MMLIVMTIVIMPHLPRQAAVCEDAVEPLRDLRVVAAVAAALQVGLLGHIVAKYN